MLDNALTRTNESMSLLEQHLVKIGIFSLLNFLFFYLLNYFNVISINIVDRFCQNRLNSIIIISSLILIFWHKLPFGFQRSKTIFIYLIFSCLFGFYPSYMLIINNGAAVWQLNFLVLSLILITILNKLIAVSIIGLSSFFMCFYLKTTFSLEIPKNIYPLVYYIIFITVIIEYLKYYFKSLEYKKVRLLEESNKKLLKAAALRTAYIIHEIRNPLHGIMGIAKILSENINFNKIEYTKQLKNIYKELNKLSVFINELLESSKLKSAKGATAFEKINLTPIIKKTIIAAQKFVDKNKTKIIFKFIANETLISGDKLKIHQLLNNILTNAIKYSGEGLITVSISADILNNKHYWKITITDQGNGILDSELEYIFEPYARSSDVLDINIGTGLGLAFCKEIVIEHNGLIWAENNKEGNGAIFTILIPKLEN